MQITYCDGPSPDVLMVLLVHCLVENLRMEKTVHGVKADLHDEEDHHILPEQLEIPANL